MRSKEQWLKLIEGQSLSGQTVTTFFNDRGINPKYFSTRKCNLEKGVDKAASQSSFVRCTASSPKVHLLASRCRVAQSQHQPPSQLFSSVVIAVSAGATLMQCFVHPLVMYLYRGHVVFRKSINGLVAIVEQEI